MKSRILVVISTALAFSNLCTLPLLADDDWLKVYGKIHMTLDKVDEENGDKQWEINSNSSRFGIKGHGPAGNGLEAFYQLEWGVDLADKATDNIKSRNQIVGIRGGFGEVFLGRHDTPTKKVQKKIDLFSDLIGDVKHTFNGEKRSNNILQYTTPKIVGFTVKTAFIPGEATGVNDGLADGSSISLEYAEGKLNIGVSFDSDVEAEGVDTSRLMAQYKIAAWQFGFMYQSTENMHVNGNGVLVSAKYSFGNNAIKLQRIESDLWRTSVSSKVKYKSQTSLGIDRKLGKKLNVYSYLTLGKEGATNNDASVFGIGLVLKF